MLCPHFIYVFCIYLRTNSDLCHLQHKLIGFYNRDEKCLQRGTDCVFKCSSLSFVFKWLTCIWRTGVMIGMCQVIFSVLLIHFIFVTDQPDLSGHLKLTSFKPVTASAKAAPGGRLNQSLYQRSLQKNGPRK